MKVGILRRRGAEELFQERGLADARLARDEHELTLTPAGPLGTLVEAPQLGLPSDEPDTGLDGAGRGREHMGIGIDRVPRRLAPDLSNLPHEPKAAPVDGLDEPRRTPRVPQGSPQVANRLVERVVRHGRVWPEGVMERLLGDEEARLRHEIVERVPSLGPQGDLALRPLQPVAGEIHAKVAELQPDLHRLPVLSIRPWPADIPHDCRRAVNPP